MCVYILFYMLYYFPLEGVGGGNVKLTKLILQIGCPSYHLTSWSQSALIQGPQIPKPFYQHKIREKTKMFFECFNMF